MRLHRSLYKGRKLSSQLPEDDEEISEILEKQTESDRSLENTIQILGIGFGGGAIISGVVVQHIDKIPIPLTSPKNPPNPFYASLILSVLATLFFIGIGWLITKRQYYPRKGNSNKD